MQNLPPQLRLEERKPSHETNPEVMEMVRKQLDRDPPPSLAAIYGRAVRLDPTIRKLSLRQFNARYPLQERRRRKRAERRARRAERQGPTRMSAGAAREAEAASGAPERASRGATGPVSEKVRSRIRTTLIQYAKAVAGAGTRAEALEAVLQADAHAEALARLADGGRETG